MKAFNWFKSLNVIEQMEIAFRYTEETGEELLQMSLSAEQWLLKNFFEELEVDEVEDDEMLFI